MPSSGAESARNQPALDQLLEDISVLPFDAKAARAYGPIRLAIRERKRDAFDKLIAAQVVALNMVLVTNNEADFLGYPGVRIENWVANH